MFCVDDLGRSVNIVMKKIHKIPRFYLILIKKHKKAVKTCDEKLYPVPRAAFR